MLDACLWPSTSGEGAGDATGKQQGVAETKKEEKHTEPKRKAHEKHEINNTHQKTCTAKCKCWPSLAHHPAPPHLCEPRSVRLTQRSIFLSPTPPCFGGHVRHAVARGTRH